MQHDARNLSSLENFNRAKPSALVQSRLFVGTDGAFILRSDFFSVSPLPVVVAIVVDFFYRDRRLCRDVVWKVFGAIIDVVLTTDGSNVDHETEHEFSTDASELLEEKPTDDDDTQASFTHPVDVATTPLAG
ncbi:uncharacterized protein Nmag_4192 (plasmid) [Natrialba magadii ATCC 43099]|uniref:Uncharacterized protein n=1 Tax=Natrialba magadii (strain ATCC 43099 / DSM 3394 / CCM 3739 / CIP 104546 / IAM 13178 / JCM 8861 / NBRC 102185 / NCIMB 2190 / MS3) TaxID=547559 RepID=D3T291_NATMM|nr:hypothetical protein [Natrialba magadii]ADD07700.1 uncharacterized protein Nmag_4192 [Natrialba magadii ATCC 43099]